MERQSSTKSELEEKILSVLQEQLSNDKVAQYMNKKIKEEREVNRHMVNYIKHQEKPTSIRNDC